MIVLIQVAQKKWHIQIGDHEDYETINLHFLEEENGVRLDGFSIPCMSGGIIRVCGDRFSKTIAHVTKVMPKVCDAHPGEYPLDVPRFLTKLAKKFKVTDYQINVNSDFDWSNLRPWSVSAVVAITQDLRRMGWSLKLKD